MGNGITTCRFDSNNKNRRIRFISFNFDCFKNKHEANLDIQAPGIKGSKKHEWGLIADTIDRVR